MHLNFRRSKLLVSTALAGLVTFGIGGVALAADPTYQFDIPAEALSQALTDFSQASSQQIIYSEDLVKGRKTVGLHGRFSPIQALTALLSGTDLKIETNSSGVLMVRSKNVQAASNEAANTGEIETVTVTGTQIVGVAPISPLTTLSSDDLLKHGYTRLDDALASLPQNFKAGVSVESNPNLGLGQNAQYNNAFASGVNLRGLGGNSTLVLMNGHRLADTAFGDSTDVSKFPLSMIDRVEILTDGASATYGADAIAGVVNIITKKNFEGLETGVRSSNIADGKAPDYDAYVLGGYQWGSGGALLTYDYNWQSPLSAASRPELAPPNKTNRTFGLLPQTETNSVYGQITQAVNSSISISADGFYAWRTFNAPFGGPTVIPPRDNSGGSGQIGADIWADIDFGAGWSSTVTASLSQDHDHVFINYPGIGLANRRTNYQTNSVEARVNGDLWELPGGTAKLAVGALYRREDFDYIATGFGGSAPSRGDRDVFSVYSELSLPIISAANDVPWVNSLRLDAAARYDTYTAFGGTLNPKFGLEWKPVEDVSVHGTYATSYRVPTLFNLAGGAFQQAIFFPDPDATSPTGSSYVLYQYNQGSANLKPETSTSYNAGLTINSLGLDGLTADVSYFDISFRNKVEALGPAGFDIGTALAQAAQLGPYLTLNPTAAEVTAATAPPAIVSYYDADFNPVAPVPASQVKAIAYIGYANVASSHPSGVDVSLKYVFENSLGRFSLNSGVSYFLSYESKVTPTSAALSGVGDFALPVKARANTQISWDREEWSAYGRLNYTGSYHNSTDLTCGGVACPVDSWTTLDAGVGYAIGKNDSSITSGLRISLDVSNLFDAGPPHIGGQTLAYDPTNASPLGRAFSISLTKAW